MADESTYIEIMRENWQHARHIESERMWFANLYAVILVALIAYIGENWEKGIALAPLFALLGISLVWLLVTLKLNASFANHIKSIQNIFDDRKIDMGTPEQWRKYMGMPLSYHQGLFNRAVRVQFLLVAFYCLSIVTLLGTIVYTLSSSFGLSLGISLGAIALIASIICAQRWRGSPE